jgi:hypothetical protein
VIRYFETHRGLLTRQLREALSSNFAGIASMIRVARNDAGHPARGKVDRGKALVFLRLFPYFRDWAYNVMAEVQNS